jgi:hypothetical protein
MVEPAVFIGPCAVCHLLKRTTNGARDGEGQRHAGDGDEKRHTRGYKIELSKRRIGIGPLDGQLRRFRRNPAVQHFAQVAPGTLIEDGFDGRPGAAGITRAALRIDRLNGRFQRRDAAGKKMQYLVQIILVIGGCTGEIIKRAGLTIDLLEVLERRAHLRAQHLSITRLMFGTDQGAQRPSPQPLLGGGQFQQS